MGSSESDGSEETLYKLAVIARTDLGMSAGKVATQVGHAVAETFEKSKNKKMIRAWQDDGGMIVVLQAGSQDQLGQLKTEAKKHGLANSEVIDYGLTEVESGTLTALAVGPDEIAKVDRVSGRLQLLRNVGTPESEVEEMQSRLKEMEAQVLEFQRRNSELEQLLVNGAVAPSPGMASLPMDPTQLQEGEFWAVRVLTTGSPSATATVPELFEQWTWEGDLTCLPFKWEQALEECCDNQVPAYVTRPWEASNFDDQGIFFITSRSETCGIALTVGGDSSTGFVAGLGVKPWCRRRGVGRCLLRLCLQRHAELGRSRIFCAVHPTRSPEAWSLLQSEGFEKDAGPGRCDLE